MKNKCLLIPYITAGYPLKKSFVPILKTLSKFADFIEVGVPHSDPLADGPIIQNASKVAIENHVTLKWIIVACCSKPLQGKIKPLILFSYLNPILNYGFLKLLKDLSKKLFCGLIIPDLPLEEAKNYIGTIKKHGLYLIPLIAPTTNKERLKKILNTYSKTPFIYLISTTGTTGIRKTIPEELKEKIKEIKKITKTPIVVGFGISNPIQIKQTISYGADGVVIGSALINLLSRGKEPIKKLNKFMYSLQQMSSKL